VAFGTVLSGKLHGKIVGEEGVVGGMRQHVLWASVRSTEWQFFGGPEPGRQTVSRDAGREDGGKWVCEYSS
jgi:hypothetical protein